ncbi:SRPBCC family protein [Deinococcus sp. RM]|uniref:SRPBCC family protein n=1 Tax=Deinococcus sp. RM TaxID=2316359 RepID=UPI001F3A0CF9|nr:SRPBCC family protein [Deinococcus sp. RM]
MTLPSPLEILITRDFRAPRHLLYRAYTTPELVRRWWSSDLGQMTTVEIDLREGGHWRYVMQDHQVGEVGFHGEFRQIVPNECLVMTEVYEAMPEGEAVNTVTFQDHEGGTRLKILVKHTCQEHRDGHLHSGMEEGMQKSLDFLEHVAQSSH